MEDCCAVCAEPLEWVGYGPCGHREVCFTCIARLRFVLNDKRCCICKQDCAVVFVTKALGDYTRVVNDWKSLLNHHSSPGEGTLLYDSFVEAYFDDEEPYKTIKAMCRLYCSICEKANAEEAGVKGMMKKGYIFKNIDTLKRHQFMVHKVYMCELCLEGRKVFICEQKLYSKSQLDQHSSKGDSEVDGNEEERGGFAGHPMCAFCRKRFYGDNELYQHMTQDHYTCHICQRARPGHYEYYRNYDDLEAHFRQEHLLCEHSDCLAKKFVVFTSEAELKRHNATTHGGHMSRSQRNAALQIPVSFHYRRPGQDSSDESSNYSSRRGNRGRGSQVYTSNGRSDELDAVVRASFESAQLEEAVRESSAMSSSLDRSDTSNSQVAVERSTSVETEVVTSSTQGDGENEPSRYLAAVWGAGPAALGDAAFPPLPGTSKSSRRRAKQKNQGPASMAALLSGNGLGRSARSGIRVLNAAETRSSSGPSQLWPLVSPGIERARPDLVSTSSNRSEGIAPPSIMTSQLQTGTGLGTSQSPPGASQGATGGGSLSIGNGVLPKDSRAPQEKLHVNKELTTQIGQLSMEDIRAANKALVERIRSGLEGNEQQFADFKDVSSSFRKGEMSSKDYYGHIARLGLSYVVPELARLCPDPRKGKELMDAHAAQLTNNIVDLKNLHPGLAEAFSRTPQPPNELERSGMTTGKSLVSDSSSSGLNGGVPSTPSLANSSRVRTEDGLVEVLSTDGYRRAKGKSKIAESSSSTTFPGQVVPSTEGTLLNELAAARDRTPQVLVRAFPLFPVESPILSSKSSEMETLEGTWACGLCTLVNSSGFSQCAACGTGKPIEEANGGENSSSVNEKRKKKIPKFQRVRLGDGSATALLDSSSSDPRGHMTVDENEKRNLSRSSGQGVWNNNGGQRLVSMVQREVADDAWSRVSKH